VKPHLTSFIQGFIHISGISFLAIKMLNSSQTYTITSTTVLIALYCYPDALLFHCSELRLKSLPGNYYLGTSSDFIHSYTMETLEAPQTCFHDNMQL